MLPRLSPANAPVSPSPSCKQHTMFTSFAGAFRMRQVLSDLSQSVMSGRESIRRFSVRSHTDAFPRLMANGGRFSLPDDRDFYADVLLAAALSEDDFPAFTTATSILLMDLLQNGARKDNLDANWDVFQGHYRLADANVRAAIMNAFRLGSEMGAATLSTPPSATDCLTNSASVVKRQLYDAGYTDLLEAVTTKATAKHAGLLWARSGDSADARAIVGFRYLYERPMSLTPPEQDTAPLIRWS